MTFVIIGVTMVASMEESYINIGFRRIKGVPDMKKKILFIVVSALTLAAFTACGKKSNPVVQETELGIKLENDAKEVVQQQQDSYDGQDQMLQNYTGE